MQLYRDVCGHPTAETLCEAYSDRRAEFVPAGSPRLGMIEYFTGVRRSVVDVYVDHEGTTMVILWPFFDHTVVSLKTVLSDGTILETRMDPEPPRLLKRMMHQGDRSGAGVIEQMLGLTSAPETWRAHRARTAELGLATGSSPVRIRTLRAYCGTLERQNEVANRSVAFGTMFVLSAPMLAIAALVALFGAGLNAPSDYWWLIAVVAGSFLLVPFAGRIVAKLPVWRKAPLADLMGEHT